MKNTFRLLVYSKEYNIPVLSQFVFFLKCMMLVTTFFDTDIIIYFKQQYI